MFKVQHLGFSYGDRKVFDDLNLEIKDSFSGVVGVNGAGKTTLVKLSLHLLKPDRGKIIINGNDVTRLEEFQRVRFGVLHENPRFPPWIKVFPYLVWIGRIRGFNKQEAQSQATLLLKELDLIDRWDTYVNELSAGLKQRFGLAQALIGLPELVFLDEPTANLDPISRVKVLEFLKRIVQKHEIQIILFSHILSDLEKYCDSVTVIHQGEVKYQAPMEQLFNDFHLKDFILRVSPSKQEALISLLRENQVNVMEYSRAYIRVISEEKTLRKIQEEQGGFSISPYKSVLEQAFSELVNERNTEKKRRETYQEIKYVR